ncbi:unnamed protein product, partial [Polarella glacialis]
ELNWWSAAHLEYACRIAKSQGNEDKECADLTAIAEPLLKALTARCAAEAEEVQKESTAFQDGPPSAAASLEPWAKRGQAVLGPDSSVLVYGPGRQVRRSLRKTGATVVPWRRFASGPAGVATRSWPPTGVFDACALRYPNSSDAFEFAMNAIASSLRPGAPLWVYGDVREGVLGATRTLKGLFDLRLPIQEVGDVRVLTARRTKKDPQAPLEAWLRKEKINLGDGPRSWVSLPGLFAGGLIDVMTQYLLDTLAQVVGDAAEKKPPLWFLPKFR